MPVESSLSGLTYARELGAAVTALGDSAALLEVKDTELATGSLGDSGDVGGGVVAAAPSIVSLQCPFLVRGASRSREREEMISRYCISNRCFFRDEEESTHGVRRRRVTRWLTILAVFAGLDCKLRDHEQIRSEEFRDLVENLCGWCSKMCPLSWRIRGGIG